MVLATKSDVPKPSGYVKGTEVMVKAFSFRQPGNGNFFSTGGSLIRSRGSQEGASRCHLAAFVAEKPQRFGCEIRNGNPSRG